MFKYQMFDLSAFYMKIFELLNQQQLGDELNWPDANNNLL